MYKCCLDPNMGSSTGIRLRSLAFQYIQSVSDIIRKHKLDYEFFADDGQLYVVF